MSRVAATIACVIAASIVPGMGQVEIRPSAVYVGHASFKGDSAGLARLEVYYQVYPYQLSFVRDEGQYKARYAINAVVKKDDKQIDAREREDMVAVESYAETKDESMFVVNGFVFHVEPGKYRLVAALTDLNASSTIDLETDLEVPDFTADKPSLSGIEFAREISSIDEPSPFDKGAWRVIPAPSRRYGQGSYMLEFYYEYYDQFQSDSVQFIYEIRTKRNDVVYSQAIDKPRNESHAYADSISLEKLGPGPYDLIVAVPTGKKDKFITATGGFELVWSSSELVKNDFNAAVDQLQYIASAREMDDLRDLPEDQRIAKWNEFWKSKDPSPGTEENELKSEYYRRLAYANRRFSVSNKLGWKTDMGMIHIIYGEPDDIERHPFDIDTKPYELWYYYNPRRRFLFIDVRGYGEYELQYPYDGDINKRINIFGGGP